VDRCHAVGNYPAADTAKATYPVYSGRGGPIRTDATFDPELHDSVEALAEAIKQGALDNFDKQPLLTAINNLMLAMMWEIMRRIDKDYNDED